MKKAYFSEQIVSIIARLSDALVNLTFENPDTLQPVARQLDLVIKTTPLVTLDDTTTGITTNANIVAIAFDDNMLQQGNNISNRRR